MRFWLVLLVKQIEFDVGGRMQVIVRMQVVGWRCHTLAHSIGTGHLRYFGWRRKLGQSFLASHILHELLLDHFVLLLLVFLEHHSLKILLLLGGPLVQVVVLASRLEAGLRWAQTSLYDIEQVIPLTLLARLLPQVPLTALAKRIRHLIGVHFQFQYLFFVEHILYQQFAVRLQRNRPITLEIFPVRLRLVVPRCHIDRRVVHIVLTMSLDNYVLVFENLGIRLPVRIYENAGAPNWKFLLARVQRQRVCRVPAAQLRAAASDLDNLTGSREIAVESKFNGHHFLDQISVYGDNDKNLPRFCLYFQYYSECLFSLYHKYIHFS